MATESSKWEDVNMYAEDESSWFSAMKRRALAAEKQRDELLTAISSDRENRERHGHEIGDLQYIYDLARRIEEDKGSGEGGGSR